jgi:hypothetical protein
MTLACRPAVLALAALLGVGVHPAARTQDIDPTELMRRVQRQDTAPGEQVEFSMRLTGADGRVRERTGTVYERQRSPEGILKERLIRYHSPVDIEGSGVLSIEQDTRADDQWLYLPAYHTTRRIVSANRGDRYMGTDFFYEDIVRDRLEDYRYETVRRETLNGTACLVIDGRAVAPGAVKETAYSKKRLWIDPARDVILKVEFYNRAGDLFKRLSVLKVESVGKWHRWQDVRMEDMSRNHATVIAYSNRVFQPVPARYFTEQYLKRGR